MSTDRTPDYIRGFLLPLKQFNTANIWDAQSTYTQGTARAGIPVSNDSVSLNITASGTQEKAVDIKTESAGHVSDDAGFVWKESADSEYLGWDTPTMISNLDIALSNGGSAFVNYVSRDAIRLPNNRIIVVAEKNTATNNDISITSIDTDGTSSSQTIHTADLSSLGGQKRFPCICLMPDDSIIVAYWITNNVEDLANIEVQRSTDNGDNWTLVSSRAIPEDISTESTFGASNPGYDLDRLTMASNSSQVLLFVGLLVHDTTVNNQNIIYQYASTNAGLKYKLIDQTPEDAGTKKFYYPDIVVFNDAFIISWISSPDNIDFTRLSNATESIVTKLDVAAADTLSTDFSVATQTGGRMEDGNKTMWLDTDGRIYLAYVRDTTHTKISGAYSDLQGVSFPNYGKKWVEWGIGTSGVAEPRMVMMQPPAGASDGGIINISGVSGLGSQILFCQWDPDGTNNYKGSIFQLSLGGYSTVNYPELLVYPKDENRGYTTLDWLPIDIPDQGTVWTKTTTGSPTATLRTTLEITCGSAEILYYSRGITNKFGGLLIHTQTSNITGTSSTRGNGIGIQIQEQGSTDTIYVEVLISSTAIYIYDAHVGYTTPLDSVTGLSLGITDILIYVDNDNNTVTLYYAEGTTPRKYSKLSGNLTTDTNSTQKIEWGIISSTGTPRSAEWHFFSFSEYPGIGLGINDNLNAKSYSPQGYYTPLSGGLKISSLDGPAREGDLYSIDPRYDYPISRLFFSTSPSRQIPWQSSTIKTDPDTNDTDQVQLAWLLDAELGATDNVPMADTMGIHLANINFEQIQIEKYSGGVWSTLGIFSNSIGGSFNFSRNGNSITCTDSTGVFLHFAECTDYHILLDNGSGTELVRTIKTNSEGVLANTSSKKAVLKLADAQGSDPTSGTAKIIPTSLTILLHNLGNIAALRITIPGQRTKQGFFKIGCMVMGPMVIPANQYSRGRTITLEADVQEEIRSNGVLRARHAGIGGRIARIAWTEGVDISELYNDPSDPDYWKASTAGQAIAAQGSAPTTMMGLLSYMDGSTEALVYLPSIPTGSASTTLINRYHDHVLATMGLDVAIENIVGDESRGSGVGEVLRVGTILLREIR